MFLFQSVHHCVSISTETLGIRFFVCCWCLNFIVVDGILFASLTFLFITIVHNRWYVLVNTGKKNVFVIVVLSQCMWNQIHIICISIFRAKKSKIPSDLIIYLMKAFNSIHTIRRWMDKKREWCTQAECKVRALLLFSLLVRCWHVKPFLFRLYVLHSFNFLPLSFAKTCCCFLLFFVYFYLYFILFYGCWCHCLFVIFFVHTWCWFVIVTTKRKKSERGKSEKESEDPSHRSARCLFQPEFRLQFRCYSDSSWITRFFFSLCASLFFIPMSCYFDF